MKKINDYLLFLLLFNIWDCYLRLLLASFHSGGKCQQGLLNIFKYAGQSKQAKIFSEHVQVIPLGFFIIIKTMHKSMHHYEVIFIAPSSDRKLPNLRYSSTWKECCETFYVGQNWLEIWYWIGHWSSGHSNYVGAAPCCLQLELFQVFIVPHLNRSTFDLIYADTSVICVRVPDKLHLFPFCQRCQWVVMCLAYQLMLWRRHVHCFHNPKQQKTTGNKAGLRKQWRLGSDERGPAGAGRGLLLWQIWSDILGWWADSRVQCQPVNLGRSTITSTDIRVTLVPSETCDDVDCRNMSGMCKTNWLPVRVWHKLNPKG